MNRVATLSCPQKITVIVIEISTATNSYAETTASYLQTASTYPKTHLLNAAVIASCWLNNRYFINKKAIINAEKTNTIKKQANYSPYIRFS